MTPSSHTPLRGAGSVLTTLNAYLGDIPVFIATHGGLYVITFISEQGFNQHRGIPPA